jgi:hypothetical protein
VPHPRTRLLLRRSDEESDVVDNLNTNVSEDIDLLEVEPQPGGLKGFLQTSTGRLVGGGVAFIVVLGALSAIAFVFFLQPGDGGLDPLVTPAGGVEAPTTTSAEEDDVTARSTKPLSSTFVFRDVFEPTVKPTVESTGTPSSSTDATSQGDTPGGTASVPADTLYLESISTVDGIPVANLVWNGKTYQAAEGDQLEGTPWQVLEISGTTVVMLYGDSRVTLTVGQGISK